ncbi:GntR family transcriptional regulator [Kribbella aluminosa]|uniref:GntR family transcriptional regulator n=2 Tax=Kribbella aluminosa TaxID=416017 RepID=A0ABS4UMY5_9ACTN|nr:GntR family transcriptional regulator [Kribbella aluminosa]MBP2353012.1 GntR family transcriptional regulator [Kribbella aluminosa]
MPPLKPPRRAEDQTRRVRDLLRAEIVAGGFGDRSLPSEEELRLEFGVPRASVRQALDLLQAEGLIERVRGQGTFVVGLHINHTMGELHGVEDPAEDSVWNGRMRAGLVDWRDVPAPPPVARMLRVPPGTTLLRIDYVAHLDDMAFGGATNYLTYPEASALRPEMFHDDFYALLRKVGIRLEESVFRLDATTADEYDAELYGISEGDPMASMEMVYSINGRPVDAAFGRSWGTKATFLSRAVHVAAKPGGA